MNEPATNETRAWQPLTPRGVARFAHASLRRLLLVQFVFALAIAATVVWFADTAWSPVISKAIQRLPATGEIRSGRLAGVPDTPQSLAQGQFLALALDLNHTGKIRSSAHVQVEFGRSDVRFIALLGYSDRAYPASRRIIPFNRTELEPWWGAWRPPILWMVFGMATLWLLVSWGLLATLYSLPICLAGFFANRNLDFRASWKLAGASLLPAAVLMMTALVFYGLGVLDLVQLAAAAIAHFIVGWIYAAISLPFVPRHPETESARKNPFAPPAG